jgi:hypothetical protein
VNVRHRSLWLTFAQHVGNAASQLLFGKREGRFCHAFSPSRRPQRKIFRWLARAKSSRHSHPLPKVTSRPSPPHSPSTTKLACFARTTISSRVSAAVSRDRPLHLLSGRAIKRAQICVREYQYKRVRIPTRGTSVTISDHSKVTTIFL